MTEEVRKVLRWVDEDWSVEHPEANQCRDCIFRTRDTRLGNSEIKGYTLAYCEVYPIGNWKPNDVLFDREECLYCQSEREGDEE